MEANFRPFENRDLALLSSSYFGPEVSHWEFFLHSQSAGEFSLGLFFFPSFPGPAKNLKQRTFGDLTPKCEGPGPCSCSWSHRHHCFFCWLGVGEGHLSGNRSPQHQVTNVFSEPGVALCTSLWASGFVSSLSDDVARVAGELLPQENMLRVCWGQRCTDRCCGLLFYMLLHTVGKKLWEAGARVREGGSGGTRCQNAQGWSIRDTLFVLPGISVTRMRGPKLA